MMPKGNTDTLSTSKRRHSSSKEENSSTDDETQHVQRKTARDKIRGRNSSQSDNEKMMSTGKSNLQASTSNLSSDDIEVHMESEKEEEAAEIQSEKCDCAGTNEGEKVLEHDTGKTDNIVEVEVKDKDETERLFDEKTQSLKVQITEIEKFWAEVEPKEVTIKQKETPNPFLYDFLGEEVDKDEAEALQALSLYWLATVAKTTAKPKTAVSENDKAFYARYCDGSKELSVQTAMRLMSLPHVVTVTLKSVPKIEVVVSDVVLALEASPELRSDDFEVTEAMGMHLF